MVSFGREEILAPLSHIVPANVTVMSSSGHILPEGGRVGLSLPDLGSMGLIQGSPNK